MEENKIGTTLKKSQTAEIPTKNGNKYSYQYIDIAQIHDYLESINSKYIQCIKRIENDDYIMTKRCFNNKWEDEWLQGCRVVQATLMGNNNPAQEQGSALTYARRYSLLMAFGLATDDDDAQSLTLNLIKTKEDAEKKIVNLGKYNGKTLKEIKETNESYLEFILGYEKASESLKNACSMLVEQHEDISLELIKLKEKAERLIIEKNVDREEIINAYKKVNPNIKELSDLSKAQLKQIIERLEKK